MKRQLWLLLLWVSPVVAGDTVDRFAWTGIVADAGGLSFSVQDRQTSTSGWFRLGGQVGDFTIKTYDAPHGLLTLAKGTETVALAIGQGVAPSAGDSAERLKEAELRIERLQEQLADLRAAVATIPKEALTAAGLHRLEPGDTMMKVAHRYGLQISDLAAWNAGVDFRRLRVGQLIRTRAPVTPPPPAARPQAESSPPSENQP
jgi:LysM repeat protein